MKLKTLNTKFIFYETLSFLADTCQFIYESPEDTAALAACGV